MSIINTARQRIANIIAPTAKNSMGTNLARDFWRYGNRQGMQVSEWSQLLMKEEDKYTGYMYGAIDRRAKKVAMLAKYNLRTVGKQPVMDAAKAKDETLVHPYLKLINDSTDFSNWEFWYEVQTYLDLKGVYYLFALRNKRGDRTGDVQSFKLINPYDVTVVRDQSNMQIIAYVETRDGMSREIDPHMIIPMRKLNPFSRVNPFSMSDAAKDAQFTLKESHDQIRSTVRRNKKFPGVLLVGDDEVHLEGEQLANLKARLLGNRKADEPMFAEGKGALDWNDMQLDLRKSAPKDTDEINLKALIAATGVSKTKFGIEESGTTRDTSQVQDDQFTVEHAMPELQLIIDALSLDYQRNYPDEYKKTGFEMEIDNPTSRDHDAEIKDIKVRKDSHALYNTLVNEGYDRELAAKYADGKVSLAELGEPTNKPKPAEDEDKPKTPDNPSEEEEATANAHTCCDGHDLPVARNQLDDTARAELDRQAATLKTAVVSVQQRLVAEVLNHVERNAYTSEGEVVPPEAKQSAVNELAVLIAAYYLTIMPLYAGSVLSRRLREFGKTAVFSLGSEARAYITKMSSKAAESHIDTIIGDILVTARQTYDDFIEEAVKAAGVEAGDEAGRAKTKEEILREARERANSGEGRRQIVAAIRKRYTESISQARAEAVARTEANRAFNRSQYEADRQFIQQNDLQGKAYKKLINRSGNPCPVCRAKAAEPPIPFDEPFAKLGDTLSAAFDEEADGRSGVQIIPVNYEVIHSGNIHVQCECGYVLIIIE